MPLRSCGSAVSNFRGVAIARIKARRASAGGRYPQSILGGNRQLRAEGKSLASIVRETGFNWRTVHKWTRLEPMRPRATMAPKPTAPSGFSAYLARRWTKGCTMGKQLLAEIRPLGYTGS